MTYRNTFAALAALVCLLVCPTLPAARPTRPAHPAPRFATTEPHLRATRSRIVRKTAVAATRRNAAAKIPASRRSRHTATTPVPVSNVRGTSRGKRQRRNSQHDLSPVARSSHAGSEHRTQRQEPTRALSVNDPEVRSRLRELDATAAIPSLLPPPRTLALYDARGRLIMPAPLRGSHEVLLHQNEMADRDGLARVQDDDDLAEMRQAKKLVPLPAGDTLRVDERLPQDRRYSRPWTAVFLTAMARDFYAKFGAPLQVDSAVRTVAVQKHLVRTNGNAAPAQGETASPHLTGQAVDVAKRGLTLAEIAWLRLYLQPLMDAGKIDVEEEFRQACFHISVYKSYVPALAPRISVASSNVPVNTEP
jgi:uncharacterized protein DUF5715